MSDQPERKTVNFGGTFSVNISSTLIQNSRADKKMTFPNNRPKEIKFLSMYSA